MDILVSGEDRQLVTLEKFVVTVFLDVPKPGECTTFAEICTTSRDPFKLIIPSTVPPQSQPDLYLDSTTCERLFSGYSLLDESTGLHRQRVGELILKVHPTKVKLTPVATNTPLSERKAFRVAFPQVQQSNLCYGTWLSWIQTTPYSASRQNSHFRFRFRADSLTVKAFCAFLVLPVSLYPLDPLCEFVPSRSPLSLAYQPNPSTQESELDLDIPIFPAWQPIIYGRRFLRNKGSLTIDPGSYVSISMRAVSLLYERKITTWAYFTGASLAVSGSLFANSLFALHQYGESTFTIGASLVSAALLAISAFTGYWVLKLKK